MLFCFGVSRVAVVPAYRPVCCVPSSSPAFPHQGMPYCCALLNRVESRSSSHRTRPARSTWQKPHLSTVTCTRPSLTAWDTTRTAKPRATAYTASPERRRPAGRSVSAQRLQGRGQTGGQEDPLLTIHDLDTDREARASRAHCSMPCRAFVDGRHNWPRSGPLSGTYSIATRR